jgi:hypothetical protein
MHAVRWHDEGCLGFGFGLLITREGAELYEGWLNFDRSSLGNTPLPAD